MELYQIPIELEGESDSSRELEPLASQIESAPAEPIPIAAKGENHRACYLWWTRFDGLTGPFERFSHDPRVDIIRLAWQSWLA